MSSGVAWIDLTTSNAEQARNFYMSVVGWQPSAVQMSDAEGIYSDYNMNDPISGNPMAGICHARGANAPLPPVWLVYLPVFDLDQSIAECNRLGGEVILGPKNLSPSSRYCVIRDPAGAPVALYQEDAEDNGSV